MVHSLSSPALPSKVADNRQLGKNVGDTDTDTNDILIGYPAIANVLYIALYSSNFMRYTNR